jgi:hypothetical protein
MDSRSLPYAVGVSGSHILVGSDLMYPLKTCVKYQSVDCSISGLEICLRKVLILKKKPFICFRTLYLEDE